MDATARKELAEYLRRASSDDIAEDEFYQRFNAWREMHGDDALFNVVFREVEHFWANFHERNIFFIPVKPDKYQLEAARERMRILAKALEENWDAGRANREASEY